MDATGGIDVFEVQRIAPLVGERVSEVREMNAFWLKQVHGEQAIAIELLTLY